MVKISLTKPIAILLLLLTATPYLYFFIHSVEQNAARHEMEERLEKEILQTISINSNDIKWAEEGKEIWLGDRLFDVKSMEKSGDHIALTGLFDDEETLLVKTLIKDQQKQNAGGNKLITGFFYLFNYSGSTFAVELNLPPLSKNRFSELLVDIVSHHPTVLTPPPRC